MDPTPSRRGLLPAWALPAAIVLALVLAAVGGWAWYRSRSIETVSVPTLTGLEVPVARSRLGERGLTLVKGDERFSTTVPAGDVLDQEPAAGTLVPKGSTVEVAVSVGSETFTMPDLTGEPLSRVKASLRELGLTSEVDVVESDRPKDTVLQTIPAPGARVRSTDVVRLTVSSGEATDAMLLPSDLTGRTFVIDPSPAPTASADASGVTDVPLETSRRLRALLEASGAKVVVTRSLTDRDVSDAARAGRARVATGTTALIGLEVLPAGEPGRRVLSLSSSASPPSAYLGSIELARSLALALEKAGETAPTANSEKDALLAALPAPAVRVRLGSAADKADAAAMADPAWIDKVATAVYRALAERYAVAR